MTGFDRRTVSPCSSTIIRSTPWVEGCCGPMLRIIVSPAPKAASPASGSRVLLSGNRSTPPCSMRSSTWLVSSNGASSWDPSSVSATGRGLSSLASNDSRSSPGRGSRCSPFIADRAPP